MVELIPKIKENKKKVNIEKKNIIPKDIINDQSYRSNISESYRVAL